MRGKSRVSRWSGEEDTVLQRLAEEHGEAVSLSLDLRAALLLSSVPRCRVAFHPWLRPVTVALAVFSRPGCGCVLRGQAASVCLYMLTVLCPSLVLSELEDHRCGCPWPQSHAVLPEVVRGAQARSGEGCMDGGGGRASSRV
jgi:hypothetical protein